MTRGLAAGLAAGLAVGRAFRPAVYAGPEGPAYIATGPAYIATGRPALRPGRRHHDHLKFGGTSVADRPAIERLISIIRAARQVSIQPESPDWRGPVVVVSALGGATDRLLGLAAEAGAGDIDGAREHLRALCARHLEVAGVVTDARARAEVEQFIRQEFDALDRVVGALGVLREVTPRWLDAIAATGEILSSRIVAAALSSHGLAASWVDARQAVVTDERPYGRGAAVAGDDGRAAEGRGSRADRPARSP